MKKNFSVLLVLILCLVCAISMGACGEQEEKDLEVKSIVLDTSEAKLEFNYGETFTSDGLKVTAKMSDDSEKAVNLADCNITVPDTTKVGNRSVAVVYSGKTARYTIKVKARAIPNISDTALLEINGIDESNPYRVEAEKIDMAISNVEKAEGVESMVATVAEGAGITSGDKYITGYNVQGNYFGFKFTTDKEYENVTLVLRVANSNAVSVNGNCVKMYLNYDKTTSDQGDHEISLDNYTIQPGVCQWTDIVIRNIKIPSGDNTLTFDVQSDKVFDLDYIDFYVGKRYISSIVEISSNQTIRKELEDFDTEKAFTRADVATAHGLQDGQLFVEPVSKESPGKSTSKGTSVGAIGCGSQMSTTIRLAKDATINIKFIASAVGKGDYKVKDNWKFSIDGVELTNVENKNIKGGNVNAGEWWDWKDTSLGIYNLSAGDHLLLLENTSTDCNVDTIDFEIVSYNSYAQNGFDLLKK